VNVDVSVVVPVAAVKVTATPVCQFAEVSVNDVGLAEMAVLPARPTLTVTDADGAALSRNRRRAGAAGGQVDRRRVGHDRRLGRAGDAEGHGRAHRAQRRASVVDGGRRRRVAAGPETGGR
jgi:hypothetical protein